MSFMYFSFHLKLSNFTKAVSSAESFWENPWNFPLFYHPVPLWLHIPLLCPLLDHYMTDLEHFLSEFCNNGLSTAEKQR